MSSIVLMYHSLYRGTDTSAIDTEDLPYAVSEDQFIAQLDRIAACGAGIFDGRAAPPVVITFDDGHVSNLDIAVPLLVERGLPAYFFITTGFVGKRAGFMSEHDIAELAGMPGMIVGSHGITHQFFSDMSEEDSLRELKDSRRHLESVTNRACRSMSFPGGRYTSKTLEQLGEAGYSQWFSSDTGIVDPTHSFTHSDGSVKHSDGELATLASTLPLYRVAIRRGTPLDEFDRMIRPDPSYYRTLRRRSQAKKLLRRTIGNRLYHGLYKSLSAR